MRSLQNSQVTVSPLHAPGAILLGDAFNMRHPLTGVSLTSCMAVEGASGVLCTGLASLREDVFDT